MGAVGIVSIVLGSVVFVLRGSTLVAPAATLRWFTGAISANGPIRGMGTFVLTLGAAMAWAGASEDSTLAFILLIGGWAWVALGTGGVLFPGAARSFITAIFPANPGDRLTLWRLGGLKAVVGVLFIYFGARAL
jgi:hypothetical protein